MKKEDQSEQQVTTWTELGVHLLNEHGLGFLAGMAFMGFFCWGVANLAIAYSNHLQKEDIKLRGDQVHELCSHGRTVFTLPVLPPTTHVPYLDLKVDPGSSRLDFTSEHSVLIPNGMLGYSDGFTTLPGGTDR